MDIINANWEGAIDNEDINLASHLWEKEFLAILDKHSPKRQCKTRSVRSPHINHDHHSKMILRDKLNPKSTGLFASGTALGGGGGCFPAPLCKLDPDILES